MFSLLFFSCTHSSNTKLDSAGNDTGESNADTASVDSASEDSAVEPSVETGIEEEQCENEVLHTIPTESEQDVLYRTAIEVRFALPQEIFSLSVFWGEQEILGAMEQDGEVVRFIPNEPFLPLQEYQIKLEYCEQEYSWGFQTGQIGAPFTGDMTGSSFVFDMRNATWVQPVGVGGLFSSQFTASILLGIDSVEGESLSPIVTITEETSVEQDMCFPTVGGIFDVDFSQNPYFEVPAFNLDIVLSGFPLQVQDFSISGILLEDGSGYQYGKISGRIDARTLSIVMPNFSPDQICTLLSGFGSNCSACLDGHEYCFEIEAVDMAGQNTGNPTECVGFAFCHPQCTNNGCFNPNQGLCSY